MEQQNPEEPLKPELKAPGPDMRMPAAELEQLLPLSESAEEPFYTESRSKYIKEFGVVATKTRKPRQPAQKRTPPKKGA